jgi:hypothetical protein
MKFRFFHVPFLYFLINVLVIGNPFNYWLSAVRIEHNQAITWELVFVFFQLSKVTEYRSTITSYCIEHLRLKIKIRNSTGNSYHTSNNIGLACHNARLVIPRYCCSQHKISVALCVTGCNNAFGSNLHQLAFCNIPVYFICFIVVLSYKKKEELDLKIERLIQNWQINTWLCLRETKVCTLLVKEHCLCPRNITFVDALKWNILTWLNWMRE